MADAVYPLSFRLNADLFAVLTIVEEKTRCQLLTEKWESAIQIEWPRICPGLPEPTAIPFPRQYVTDMAFSKLAVDHATAATTLSKVVSIAVTNVCNEYLYGVRTIPNPDESENRDDGNFDCDKEDRLPFGQERRGWSPVSPNTPIDRPVPRDGAFLAAIRPMGMPASAYYGSSSVPSGLGRPLALPEPGLPPLINDSTTLVAVTVQDEAITKAVDEAVQEVMKKVHSISGFTSFAFLLLIPVILMFCRSGSS